MAEHKEKGEWVHPGQRQWEEDSGKRWFNWWILPIEILGLIGPIIGAAVSLLITLVCIWMLQAVNIIFQSELVSLLVAAVYRNLAVFFAAPLVIGYCQYFARRFYLGFALLWPVGNAVGFAFSMWTIAWLLRTIGTLANVLLLSQIGAALRESLLPIFAIVLALGYISVLARRTQN
ncbi:MAG: hypothetical protein WCY41_02130 [Candidatus Micrarchaeia archaeon]|jgi:hypothetical protein